MGCYAARQEASNKVTALMYLIPREIKQNPVKRWALDDPIFFAAGACHILCYAFIEDNPDFVPIWIKPKDGLRGNHIVAVKDDMVFDYRGFSKREDLLQIHKDDAKRQIHPKWDCELVELPKEALISETHSRSYDGLWLREPKQFLHDALPRARSYMRSIL